MSWISETAKIREKVRGYCTGEIVIDLGCGPDKIHEKAFGVDMRPLPGVNHVTRNLDKISAELYTMTGKADAVFSSHCLEHFQNDKAAVEDWIKLLKPGGFLVLYLPDDRYYDNSKNPEHLHRYVYMDFARWMRAHFPQVSLIDSGEDVGPDRYSFYIVAQKR